MFNMLFCQDVCSASGLFPSLPLTALACLWSRYLNSWQSYKQLWPLVILCLALASLRSSSPRSYQEMAQVTAVLHWKRFQYNSCLFTVMVGFWLASAFPQMLQRMICLYMFLHCFLSMKHLKWAKQWFTKVKAKHLHTIQLNGSAVCGPWSCGKSLPPPLPAFKVGVSVSGFDS